MLIAILASLASKISEILGEYIKVLAESKDSYEGKRREQVKRGKDFHEQLFKETIRPYAAKLKPGSMELGKIQENMNDFFQTKQIRFAAIDGASIKETVNEYIVFFGCSYGVKGQLTIEQHPPKVAYQKWDPDADISYTSYLPIPVSELGRHHDGFNVPDDNDAVNFNSMHTSLKRLAEVYLAYSMAKSETEYPHLLLLDNRLNSLLTATTVASKELSLFDHNKISDGLKPQHVVLANSHPYSDKLSVPYPKKPQFFQYVLQQLIENPNGLTFDELAEKAGFKVEEVTRKLSSNSIIFKREIVDGIPSAPLVVGLGTSDSKFRLNNCYEESWDELDSLFEKLCKSLFHKKSSSALNYQKMDGNPGYLTPRDLDFIAGVGLRRVIERCWEKDIMLVGISQSSNSRYLTQNLLGIRRQIEPGFATDVEHSGLTDSEACELAPHFDDSLDAPWSTIEFDGCFSTLRPVERKLADDSKIETIEGVRGEIVTPHPQLFAMSYAQFFLDRQTTSSPIAGKPILIDRLVHHQLDRRAIGRFSVPDKTPSAVKNKPGTIGVIQPVFFANGASNNVGQDVMMLCLNLITKNLFPGFVGIPDPLHKADWGAKALSQRIKPVIKSSAGVTNWSNMRRLIRELKEQEEI